MDTNLYTFRFVVNIVRKSSVCDFVALKSDMIYGAVEERDSWCLSEQRARK